MKKIFLLVGMLLAVSVASQASQENNATGDNGSAIAARATKLSRAMASTMQLDEGQYLKVKQLNTRMLAEVDDLKSRYAADPEILDQRLADAQQRYEAALTSLLRPRQLAVYQEAQSNMTALSIMAN
ncbi:hypothetical protein FY528_18335 [Hymenobacter lutimineralis]|uniref:OmpH family outer membrane protein n=1 Tax=Hymenobacter lutimineralis TaxID=2606448 RepID=A0A5D6UUK4_9BACT|nr:hypothetical protein [Hymenobacter lutimineralis]TYZ06332.1 hypothetical protein FY528_18335 [Hymenobacter lutimineralis]